MKAGGFVNDMQYWATNYVYYINEYTVVKLDVVVDCEFETARGFAIELTALTEPGQLF